MFANLFKAACRASLSHYTFLQFQFQVSKMMTSNTRSLVLAVTLLYAAHAAAYHMQPRAEVKADLLRRTVEKCTLVCSDHAQQLSTICPCFLLRDLHELVPPSPPEGGDPLVSRQQYDRLYWAILLDALGETPMTSPRRLTHESHPRAGLDDQMDSTMIEQMSDDDSKNSPLLEEEYDASANIANDNDPRTASDELNSLPARYEYTPQEYREGDSHNVAAQHASKRASSPWPYAIQGQRKGQAADSTYPMNRSKKRWLELHGDSFAPSQGVVADLWKQESGRKAFRYG